MRSPLPSVIATVPGSAHCRFRGAEQQQQAEQPAMSQAQWAAWQNWARSLQNVPQVLGQHANVAHVTQDLATVNTYGAGELLSLVGPRAATVAPWLAPGYIGLDVFNQARQAYEANQKLPQQERVKETAIKTGDVAMVHFLASIGIPLLLVKRINRGVHFILDRAEMPSWLVKHPKWVTTAAVFAVMMVLAKPIKIVTNFILDWTYRPLLERKRREEVQKIVQTQLDRQIQLFQSQPLWNRLVNQTSTDP